MFLRKLPDVAEISEKEPVLTFRMMAHETEYYMIDRLAMTYSSERDIGQDIPKRIPDSPRSTSSQQTVTSRPQPKQNSDKVSTLTGFDNLTRRYPAEVLYHQ